MMGTSMLTELTATSNAVQLLDGPGQKKETMSVCVSLQFVRQDIDKILTWTSGL